MWFGPKSAHKNIVSKGRNEFEVGMRARHWAVMLVKVGNNKWHTASISANKDIEQQYMPCHLFICKVKKDTLFSFIIFVWKFSAKTQHTQFSRFPPNEKLFYRQIYYCSFIAGAGVKTSFKASQYLMFGLYIECSTTIPLSRDIICSIVQYF